MQTPSFVLGTVVYGLSALGWTDVMRHLELANVGLVIVVTNVLLLAVLGVVVFRESLSRSEVAGIVLGAVAPYLRMRDP
jgi:drug/metabolite transporter (DMT)-like permease